MIVAPAGRFVMGSPRTEPDRDGDEEQHEVAIETPFAVGMYEITVDEWMACARDRGCNGYKPQVASAGRHPVVNVSWWDAQAYVAWLRRKTGLAYRLLSEAEWEYVARAGTNTTFPTGPSISSERDAAFDGRRPYAGQALGPFQSSYRPVGSFPPNAFGLFDMIGNVREWVEDCYVSQRHQLQAGRKAVREGSCKFRVIRSGSYTDNPDQVRAANRVSTPPDIRISKMGLRVARDLP